MYSKSNQRSAGRLAVDIECQGAATRQKGHGQISDLSKTGAMISHTAVVPVRGELVGITLDWENGPILFVGWVVRHIDDGFAIEFDHLSEAAAAFLDDSVGVVPTPGQGRVE